MFLPAQSVNPRQPRATAAPAAGPADSVGVNLCVTGNSAGVLFLGAGAMMLVLARLLFVRATRKA